MDVILLAIPVDAALDLIDDLLDQINDNTLLIDVGSTKSMICEKVAFHPKRNQFLATHPIKVPNFLDLQPFLILCLLVNHKFYVRQISKTRPFRRSAGSKI